MNKHKQRPSRKAKKGHVSSKKTSKTIEGFYSVGKNDLGYVRHKETNTVYVIPAHESLHALNRDRVEIKIINPKKNEAEVTKIIRRNKIGFSGTLREHGNHFTLVPTDGRDPEIVVPHNKAAGAEDGEKVFVKITHWVPSESKPVGEVHKILGQPGDNDAEMVAIAIEKGFDDELPAEVEMEAQHVKEKSQQEFENEVTNRRDMRDTLTFTIDPEDAKDFDDALSFKYLDSGNYEIGIHIADVSHYVRPGSALDIEAETRGTSVYLVDRTIPMLPEILSNDLCSLREAEDKLVYSAVFELTPQGEVVDRWFGRAVINSDKRFTYEEAQEILDDQSGLFFKELNILNTIAIAYRKQRMSSGALALDSDEVKFILDDQGKPLAVHTKIRIDTNRLIEEFMLLANREVATFMSNKTKSSVFVYRIHDKPDPDRTRDLFNFLKRLGFTVHMKNGVIPSSDLNALLRTVDESDTKSAIQTAVIRSMSKAIYSTENIGHYGLGFTYYTHFTSPIRRYPDILVHRLMTKCINNEPIPKEDFETYERFSQDSSAREKDAQDAEWASIKYKQVEYMSERIGETFEGTVTGFTEKGLFVAEKETRSEGMIRYTHIKEDRFMYDEKHMRALGKKTGTVLELGTSVRIKVLKTNLEKRMIDYKLVL